MDGLQAAAISEDITPTIAPELDLHASFVTETDLGKLRGKAVAGLAFDVESMLQEALAFTSVLDPSLWQTLMVPIGDLLIRCGLECVDKEKRLYDKQKISLDEIKSLCLADISKLLGQQVTYAPWSSAAAPPAPLNPSEPAAATAIATTSFLNISDYAHPVAKAKHLGFEVGDFIVEKSFKDQTAEDWRSIIDIKNAEEVVLQKVFNYDASELHRIKLSLECLATQWTVLKDP